VYESTVCEGIVTSHDQIQGVTELAACTTSMSHCMIGDSLDPDVRVHVSGSSGPWRTAKPTCKICEPCSKDGHEMEYTHSDGLANSERRHCKEFALEDCSHPLIQPSEHEDAA